MWKSASSVIGSKIGISGGENSGSVQHQVKNGRSGFIGQPELDSDSIRLHWVTAMDGVESSEWEDINDELWVAARTSISSNTSSVSSSSSPIARQGGKLFQAVKRTVSFSKGTRKASQRDRASVHNEQDSKRSRNSMTQDEEIVSHKAMEDLETLKRELEKKEEELQKLNNEVSTLRIITAIRSVQPQSQLQADTSRRYSADSEYPEEEASSQEDTGRRYSADSDSSQLSCLDFAFVHRTGNLSFEGNIKTKFASDFKLRAESGDQPHIFSDRAAVGAPLLVERLSPINDGLAPADVRSETKCSASSRVNGPDVVDKHVEATKRRLDESEAKICEPEYAARVRPNHKGGGLELPEHPAKEELHISTQSYVHETEETEEKFLDTNPNESRSPPTSNTSTEEEDQFEIPTTRSDSNNFSFLQKASPSKATNCDSGAQSSCDLSDVEVYCKSTKDGEEVDDNVLTVPFSNNDTTSSSSATKENPLRMLRNSCVTLEVDKLSKTMTSLRTEESFTSTNHRDLITEHTPVISPRRGRDETLTTRKHSVRLQRSTCADSPPRLLPMATQAYLNRSRAGSREPIDLKVKAGDSVEYTETNEFPFNRTDMDLRSKILPVSTCERSTVERMAGSNGFDFDNLPLRKSHRSSGDNSTSPQSCEYTKTIPDSREDWSLVLTPTSRRATTTADHHEGSSPFSPSTSVTVRGLRPSSYSTGSQMLHEESGWKPKSGSLQETDLEEEVRQIVEQSRLLLMSDESSSEDEVSEPASPYEPFSVLALSRHRRNTDKRRTKLQYFPEINQQQERPVEEEEQAMVLYGDANAWNIQSSKVDHFHELHAEQGHDNQFVRHPPELRDAMEASYKKDHLQLVWELEVQNSKNLLLSDSLPRRSRFFFEANIAKPFELV